MISEDDVDFNIIIFVDFGGYICIIISEFLMVVVFMVDLPRDLWWIYPSLNH